MSARITAAEAAAILRDLARGREDGNGADVWPLYDRAEDAMAAVIGLAAESDAHRTRADAAEADRDALRAECERLRDERDYWRAQASAAAPCVDAVRTLGTRLIPGGTGCVVEPERVVVAVEGLRAIVEGRTALTPDDVAAHALAHPLPARGAASSGATCDEPVGLWLCVVDGEGAVVLRLAREADDQGPYIMAWSSDYGWCGTGDIRRAWPLDASGRPCPWPTVAAEAATGAAR